MKKVKEGKEGGKKRNSNGEINDGVEEREGRRKKRSEDGGKKEDEEAFFYIRVWERT